MTKRTRLKVGVGAFILILGTAWAKNWFPGIDVTIVSLAVVNVLGYIFGETFRKSTK